MTRLTLSLCICFCAAWSVVSDSAVEAETRTPGKNRGPLESLRSDLVDSAEDAAAKVTANPHKPVQDAAETIHSDANSVATIAEALKKLGDNLLAPNESTKAAIGATASKATEAKGCAERFRGIIFTPYSTVTAADAERLALDLKNLTLDTARLTTDAKQAINSLDLAQEEKDNLVSKVNELAQATKGLVSRADRASDLANSYAMPAAAASDAATFSTFTKAIKRFGLAKLRKFEGDSNRVPVEIEEYRDARIDFDQAYADYEKRPVYSNEAKPVFDVYRRILVATTSGRDFMTKARDVGRPVFQTRQEERVAVIKYENWIARGTAFVRQDGEKKVPYLVPVQRPVLASGTHYVGEANSPMHDVSEMKPERAERLYNNKISYVPIQRQSPADFEAFSGGDVIGKMSNSNWFDKFSAEDTFYYRGFVEFKLPNSQDSERISGFHYVASKDTGLRPTKAWVVVLSGDFESDLVPSTNLGQVVSLSNSGVVLLAKPTSGNRVFIFFEKEVPLNVLLDPNREPDTDFVLPELSLIKTTKHALAPSTPQ